MRRLRQSLALLSLAALSGGGRVETLSRALADTTSLCREKLDLNLGYWRDDPPDLDAAAEALADLCARTAGLGERHEVLDVGAGFGDQDILWAERYRPRALHVLNLSGEQAARARRRLGARGLAGRVTVLRADAARLPFPAARFDVVLSVEAAFHFRTRAAFFAEAHRVLRPGGRPVLADLAAAADPPRAWRDRLAERIGRSFWQIPRENLYPLEAYRAALAGAGFDPVEARSIWDDVHPRFAAWARGRLGEPELAARMNPVFRRMLMASLRARPRLSPRAMDDLLVLARKP